MNITSTISSYPYVQWSDDPDVGAFFAAYNQMSQANLDAINGYQLPIYLNQSGALLDWAASSIYGVFRPTLSSGGPRPIGPYDTTIYNTQPYDGFRFEVSAANFIADDQTYRAIIQWNTFKGDGVNFTMRWLKRRVERFLTGDIFPDNTFDISVKFTTDTDVLIAVSETNRGFAGGALFGQMIFNGQDFNEIDTNPSEHSATALARALKAAVNSGVLLLPFQYTFTVQI